MSVKAGSFGCGGNAYDAAEDAAFEGMVANISASQVPSQGIVQELLQRNNTQTIAITQVQQQITNLVAGGGPPSAAPPGQYQQQWQ